MTRITSLLYAASAPILLIGIFAGVLLNPRQANAVVYCKAVGVPTGCVVRPAGRVVAARDRGAPGIGVRAGTPLNRGGPINRVGRR
jgi:hypothetical protein